MFFDYCTGKMYYEDVGKGEGTTQTIVFMHGWGCDMRTFYGISELLSKNFRCVLVDFLGFGKSENPKTGMSVEAQATAILSLCNFLEIKDFHIVSHSYGGRVSIFLLAMENCRVNSALLIAPAGVKEKNIKKSAKVAIFKLRKKLTRKKNIQKLEKFYSQDYQNANGTLKETFQNAIGFDQTFQLSNIKSKVLIVRGKKDTAVTKKMVKTMQKRMQNCKVIEISGDHFAFLQSSLEFKMIVSDFFNI